MQQRNKNFSNPEVDLIQTYTTPFQMLGDRGILRFLLLRGQGEFVGDYRLDMAAWIP